MSPTASNSSAPSSSSASVTPLSLAAQFGRTATVREVLENGPAFDDLTLADPIEGPEYGAEVAKFYWNNGRKSVVHSFAHGSKHVYFLKNIYGFDPSDFIFLKEDNVYFDVTIYNITSQKLIISS